MRVRSAFSLLEVSIALLLGMVLLLAVFETFFVAAQYRVRAGEYHVRGLVLANATRDLASDVAAIRNELTVPMQPAAIKQSSPAKLRSKFAQSLNFRDSFTSDARVEWATFVGRSYYVAFRTRACNARFTQVPENVSGAGDSLVVWWLYNGTPIQVEGWRNRELPITKTLKVPDHARGLIRTQFFIDRNGNQAESTQVILPEAKGLRLRYSDGDTLMDTWDQKMEAKLPRAIEVRFSVGSPDEHADIEHWVSVPTY